MYVIGAKLNIHRPVLFSVPTWNLMSNASNDTAEEGHSLDINCMMDSLLLPAVQIIMVVAIVALLNTTLAREWSPLFHP